ncbi:MAG TPA: MFS transporter [Gaiellaceae bacterium]|nr:MFS transporter [Gaiellaceae bacterium]
MTLLKLASRRTFASLRRHRNYRLFFYGQLTSVAGTWMQNIAMAWLVVGLAPHSRGLAVGILAACRFGPFTVLGLFSGVVTDRFDNRHVVIVTQSVQMAFSAALATVTLLGHVQLWEVYAIAVLTGSALVFDAPSRQNLTFQMVGRNELPNAIALNSSLFNTARIFGPALAGVLIAAVGPGWCFAVNTASFLAVLGGLLAMRVSEMYPLLDRRRPTMFRGTREGFAYALHNRTVLVTLVMTAVFSAVGFNFNILLPLLAKTTLAAGPRTFGIISACFGAGALVGALSAAAVSRTTWRVMFLGAAGFGVCELLIAPVRSTLLVGVLLFVCGIFFTSYTANSNSAIQLASPDHIRGRVLGLYYYAWNGLAPLGALIVGWMCDRGGTELAFAVGGASGIAMTVLGALAVKPPKRFTPNRVRAEPAEQIAA